MNCPFCEADTKVRDSRVWSPDVDSSFALIKPLLLLGNKVWGWFSDMFRMRIRRCVECGKEHETIEIPVSDLLEVFDELMNHTDRCSDVKKLTEILRKK